MSRATATAPTTSPASSLTKAKLKSTYRSRPSSSERNGSSSTRGHTSVSPWRSPHRTPSSAQNAGASESAYPTADQEPRPPHSRKGLQPPHSKPESVPRRQRRSPRPQLARSAPETDQLARLLTRSPPSKARRTIAHLYRFSTAIGASQRLRPRPPPERLVVLEAGAPVAPVGPYCPERSASQMARSRTGPSELKEVTRSTTSSQSMSKADVPASGGQPRLTKLGHWVLDDSSRTVESKR